MQGDDFRRAKAGDPLRIPAVAYNAMLDAAEANQRNLDQLGHKVTQSESVERVLVTNRGDDTIPMWGVAGISGHSMSGSGFDSDLFLSEGDTLDVVPADEEHALESWVLLDEACAPGESRSAILIGIVRAKIRVVKEAHRFADVAPLSLRDSSEHRMTSSTCGRAKIIWKEPGTGIKHAMLLLMPSWEAMRFRARLGVPSTRNTNPNGPEIGWSYGWSEARFDSRTTRDAQHRYVTAADLESSSLLEHTGIARALNRYESHLYELNPSIVGEEAYIGVHPCGVDGVPEACPPDAAMYPTLMPVPEGVVVQMVGERGFDGEALVSFEAMNPIRLVETTIGSSAP